MTAMTPALGVKAPLTFAAFTRADAPAQSATDTFVNQTRRYK